MIMARNGVGIKSRLFSTPIISEFGAWRRPTRKRFENHVGNHTILQRGSGWHRNAMESAAIVIAIPMIRSGKQIVPIRPCFGKCFARYFTRRSRSGNRSTRYRIIGIQRRPWFVKCSARCFTRRSWSGKRSTRYCIIGIHTGTREVLGDRQSCALKAKYTRDTLFSPARTASRAHKLVQSTRKRFVYSQQ